jgi:hypothetical protein
MMPNVNFFIFFSPCNDWRVPVTYQHSQLKPDALPEWIKLKPGYPSLRLTLTQRDNQALYG